MSHQPERERRPLAAPLGARSEIGRSQELLACPFCFARVWTFQWSRCARGKRCPCGAILYRASALAPETK